MVVFAVFGAVCLTALVVVGVEVTLLKDVGFTAAVAAMMIGRMTFEVSFIDVSASEEPVIQFSVADFWSSEAP